MSGIAAVVLAAGTASRFRARDPSLPTKLVARLDGVPIVRRAASAAQGSAAHPVIVVTGHAEAEVRAVLGDLPVQFIHNPGYATGLASSLRAGLAAVPSACAGALVLLGDMPGVTASLLDDLIGAFGSAPRRLDAVVPVHGGRRGNPVLLGRGLFGPAMALSGDEGARRLLARACVGEVETRDDAVLVDIDDPAALQGPSRHDG